MKDWKGEGELGEGLEGREVKDWKGEGELYKGLEGRGGAG